MANFEIYKRSDNQYSWRLKSANGQVIASAGEGFTTKASAEKGVSAVKRDAPSAPVKDLS